MTAKEVKFSLIEFGLKGLDKACLEAFCKAMGGRLYGVRETGNAFLWFESGWRGAQEEKQRK